MCIFQPTDPVPDVFYTIKGRSEAKYTEKMSKFLAFAFPVSDVDEVRESIAEVTRRYHDARHICWAYMLGADRLTFMSNDNGEPSGTAGKPILGQINSFGLTDVVVVVVRYFGGIKLGTSGLISAYRQAARDALDAADKVERHVMKHLRFSFGYLAMNDVMKLVKQPGVSILSQVFDNTCEMSVETRADDMPVFRKRLGDIEGVSFLDPIP